MKDILPRVWYYLLDFGDRDNHQLIEEVFNTKSLRELTPNQAKEYFEMVTIRDLITLDAAAKTT